MKTPLILLIGIVSLWIVACFTTRKVQLTHQTIGFEDGVFWGAQAEQDPGTNGQPLLLRAYELREEARRSVAEDKAALDQYR